VRCQCRWEEKSDEEKSGEEEKEKQKKGLKNGYLEGSGT
jgi:hypothetical protein